MDITYEIVNRINNYGDDWKITPVIKYYLRENVTNIFGNNIVSCDDVEIIRGENHIDIKSIYDEYTHRITWANQGEKNFKIINCIKLNESGEIVEEFTIVDTPFTSTNIMDNDSSLTTYKYNKKKEEYSLEITHTNGTKQETDYQASLVPIYAKVRDQEWFKYNREVPVKEKEKSFLKRLYDELSGNGDSRQIITSESGLYDTNQYADRIFNSLKTDASNVLNKNNSMKRIRI
jgi:hypothetical protein